MTDEDKSALRKAVEDAQKRLPKGHKLCHIHWRDGVLQFTSRPIKGEAEPTGWQTMADLPPAPVEKPKKKAARGIVQTELDL